MTLPYDKGGIIQPAPNGDRIPVRLSMGERIISSTGDVHEVTGIREGSDGIRYTTTYVGTIDMGAARTALAKLNTQPDAATTQPTIHTPAP